MPPLINAIVDHIAFNAWERDWIECLLRDFQIQFHFDPEHSLVLPNSVLIISLSKPGNESAIANHLRAFQSNGFRAGLIHLSDEWGESPINFYDQAAFLFRNYYRPALAERPNCHFFAIGYRSGLMEHLKHMPMDERRIRWSFAGQLKSSRIAMLGSAAKIPGGKYHLTQKFDDPNALSPSNYAAMLNDSVYILCPRGFHSLDCFRIYEALEAGAIPIVEDPAFDDAHQTLPHPEKSYWHQAYGQTFPCPRIADWENLPRVMPQLNVGDLSQRTRYWWTQYKSDLHQKFSQMIAQCLLDKRYPRLSQ